ncbi:hypothetical protein LXL04_000575 [Taraxacum kok-saghyz]
MCCARVRNTGSDTMLIYVEPQDCLSKRDICRERGYSNIYSQGRSQDFFLGLASFSPSGFVLFRLLPCSAPAHIDIGLLAALLRCSLEEIEVSSRPPIHAHSAFCRFLRRLVEEIAISSRPPAPVHIDIGLFAARVLAETLLGNRKWLAKIKNPPTLSSVTIFILQPALIPLSIPMVLRFRSFVTDLDEIHVKTSYDTNSNIEDYHLDIPFCSSKIQVLLLLLVILPKTELDKLRLLAIDTAPELVELEDGLSLPKNENMLRKTLPIPLSPPALFLLDSHIILLGVPELLLNPPSISVYTTGSSLSPPPALLPPENLPTANPPPGNLHIVNPTAADSSSFDSERSGLLEFESVESVGSSWRQTGQEFRRASHGRIQSE